MSPAQIAPQIGSSRLPVFQQVSAPPAQKLEGTVLASQLILLPFAAPTAALGALS